MLDSGVNLWLYPIRDLEQGDSGVMQISRFCWVEGSSGDSMVTEHTYLERMLFVKVPRESLRA